MNCEKKFNLKYMSHVYLSEIKSYYNYYSEKKQKQKHWHVRVCHHSNTLYIIIARMTQITNL